MKDNHLPAPCECGHEWGQPVTLPMDMGEFAKAVKKIRCPVCSSAKIVFIFGDDL